MTTMMGLEAALAKMNLDKASLITIRPELRSMIASHLSATDILTVMRASPVLARQFETLWRAKQNEECRLREPKRLAEDARNNTHTW